eukprot:m.152405 g.152405  ORF g.152405 m.152405 type:complete len:174 (-) comp14321_c0_seq2:1672-2193(-)
MACLGRFARPWGGNLGHVAAIRSSSSRRLLAQCQKSRITDRSTSKKLETHSDLSSDSVSQAQGPSAEAEPPRTASLGETLKRYGVAAVALHSAVYVTSLSTVFTAVQLCPEAVSPMTTWITETTGVPIPEAAGSLAVAWTLTAVTGPARGIVTVLFAPTVARLKIMRRWVGGL